AAEDFTVSKANDFTLQLPVINQRIKSVLSARLFFFVSRMRNLRSRLTGSPKSQRLFGEKEERRSE
ncbi:MAG: hypothetical protein J5562_09105, partial [Clostridia bacterium]|nr:hypothetical protein [Clostridia bacterium]